MQLSLLSNGKFTISSHQQHNFTKTLPVFQKQTNKKQIQSISNAEYWKVRNRFSKVFYLLI